MCEQTTYTPSQAWDLAVDLIARHGLQGWEFRFNRAKRIMGLCRHAQQRIELSVYFVLANDRDSVRDCLLHEIAHALAGGRAGHGPIWKRICRQVGARPERCGEARMPDGSWKAICPGCRRQFTRHRRPLKNRKYSCGDCGWARGRLQFQSASAVRPEHFTGTHR